MKKVKRPKIKEIGNKDTKWKIILLSLGVVALLAGTLAITLVISNDKVIIYNPGVSGYSDMDGDGIDDFAATGKGLALPADFPEKYIPLVSDASVVMYQSLSQGSIDVVYQTDKSISKIIKFYKKELEDITKSQESPDADFATLTGTNAIYTIELYAAPPVDAEGDAGEYRSIVTLHIEREE